MSIEKPKVQRIVINMGDAWTPEERQRREKVEGKEKGGDDLHEQKEYPKRLSSAREYIKNILSLFDNVGNDAEEEMKQEWQMAEADLDCGNEKVVMERLEQMAGSHLTSKTKKDADLCRKAIFEISKESKMESYFLNTEEVGKSLYEEFAQRLSEIDTGSKEKSEYYNEQNIKDWNKDVLQWQDAASEVTYGNSKNALVLLENAIMGGNEHGSHLRIAMKEKRRGKGMDAKGINELNEKITANSKKIAMYRRMRDSLYATEFKDKK